MQLAANVNVVYVFECINPMQWQARRPIDSSCRYDYRLPRLRVLQQEISKMPLRPQGGPRRLPVYGRRFVCGRVHDRHRGRVYDVDS